MPNLADSLMCKQFVEKLELCESGKAYGHVNDWEIHFISRMRECFDERETQMDLGMTPWNPSVGQWNQLSQIAAKVPSHG